MLKADFHIHTEYSLDCSTPLEDIIQRCLELGINCIAIADHGTTEGALKLQTIAPFTVIVAEEILTPYGEIMGMFLKDTIPSGLSPHETISRIRAQDGLVNIPHPFDKFRPSALSTEILEEIVDQIDSIEVFNSRVILPKYITQAQMFAQKHDIAKTAGSDAHTIGEIGNVCIEMPEFNGKDEFLNALEKGKIFGHRTNPLVHLGSAWARLKKQL